MKTPGVPSFGASPRWQRSSLAGAAWALVMGAAVTVHGDPPPVPVPVTWRATSSSPQPTAAEAPVASLLAACGRPDAALLDAAARTARRQAETGVLFGSDEIAFYLRAAGEPHPWPRTWALAAPGLTDDDVQARLKAWMARSTPVGVRRCGAARTTAANGHTGVAVITVDALADLSPLPTTARVGQWITLDAAMLVPATDAKVIVLGPRGAPRTVPTTLAGDKVHAVFAVDQPGGWAVQVLATVTTGPRPVLDASIYAGTPPPAQFVFAKAPGEDAGQGVSDDDDAMLRMINAARASEALSPLARDAQLDRLARAHSEEMLKVGVVGHDVGTGDPGTRLRAAGLSMHVAGENVALSGTLPGAHRALWASPSHRGNLLLDQFTRVGVAVVHAPDGAFWVTEMFGG